jgi:hypothetical protein
MGKGIIEKLEQKPSLKDFDEWWKPGECWHFWEQPDKIGIGEGRPDIDKFREENQYGRIFSNEMELRWEGGIFWIAKEEKDGEYDIEEAEIILRKKKEDDFGKIKAVHYKKDGIVVYTRFKEAIK